MKDQIIQFIHEQINNNDIFKGGLLLMLGGAILAVVRSWPGRVWNFIKRQSMIVIDIPDRDTSFTWVNLWLSEHSYSKNWSRLLTIRTERNSERFSKPKIIFSPAPGNHWLWYRGRLVILSRERQQLGGGDSMSSNRDPFREYFTIRILGRDRSIVRELINDAYKLSHPHTVGKLKIHRSKHYGDWVVGAWVPERALDSVILPEGLSEQLVQDIQTFKDSEDWYTKRGIPYRLGCLFYGPPGNGKTSAVIALASHFDMDIGRLSIKSTEMSDDDLGEALSNVPENTIVLIEDIDCLSEGRVSNTDITFSGLLNALDGLGASHGQIVFMTTNHIDKLDPALIRPGRCDIQIELRNADESQKERLFNRFFPDSGKEKEFASLAPSVSMARLQKHLMQYRNNADEALKTASHIEGNCNE